MLKFVCRTGPTCDGQRLGPVSYDILCFRHGLITSAAVLNEDTIGRGDLWVIITNCLALRLSDCRHVIVT